MQGIDNRKLICLFDNINNTLSPLLTGGKGAPPHGQSATRID